MSMIIYIFLLVSSVFLSGCHPSHPESQLPQEEAADNEESRMIQIENLTVTEKALTLDYHVSNPFTHDIRICQDIDTEGKYDVETRIDAETVWIRLRLDCVTEHTAVRGPVAIAKYLRLPPGESHSGRILLDLPIRNASPAYDLRFWERRKKRKEIVLHHAVFEVGYFGPKWNKFFDSKSERIKQEPIKSKPTVIRSFYYLSFNPFITEETLDGKLREVIYVQPWSSVRNQECAQVLITDVDIPCSVSIDDK